jgi:hypothetical protein
MECDGMPMEVGEGPLFCDGLEVLMGWLGVRRSITFAFLPGAGTWFVLFVAPKAFSRCV